MGMALTEQRIPVGQIHLNSMITGEGSPVVLLHGFPHTWRVWTSIIPELATEHRVIAPDLRGFGASTVTADGYDAATLATDLEHLLDALEVDSASVAAIDAAVAPAFLFALRHPGRVKSLALMEGTLGRLPGAEQFFSGGPPWWFGFHAVPGLAEGVLTGNESAYVDWFLEAGTGGRGVPDEVRDPILAAFGQPDGLRGPLAYYRSLPQSARQLSEAVASRRLRVPTLAIGAEPVGAALAGQLRPVADDLVETIIDESGHIIPIDRPDRLLDVLRPFLRDGSRSSMGKGGQTAV